MVLAIAAIAAWGLATSALAAETINATFTAPDGGVTAGSYAGVVDVTVSGVGQSDASSFNDAFYIYSAGPPFNDPNYYQLTFGTSTLAPYDASRDAKNFLVGALPAYNSNHVYSFQLDTGLTTLGQLHFGVADGIFGDNSGAYTISIAAPEPAAWALMLIGLGAVGFGVRRSRTVRAAAL
jgi:hypothetical protein